MPAFFAVSGWFAGEASKKKLVRRMRQLLVPYGIWAIIFILFNEKINVNSFVQIVITPDRSYWFLWVLFWINGIFILAQMVARYYKWNEMSLLATVCVILVLIMAVCNIRVFGMQFITYYFIFYYMGYCLHNLRFKFLYNNNILVAFAVAWMFLGWYWQMSHVPAIMKWVTFLPSSLVIQGYRFVTAFLALSVIISIAPRYLDSVTWVTRRLVRFGYISLGIYTFHLLILNETITFLRLCIPSLEDNLLIFLSFVLLTIISFFCVSLISKNKVLAKLLLGKI